MLASSHTDALDVFVAKLYRSALSVAPDKYRNWCLSELRRVIPFDYALWGSGSRQHMRFHTVELLGLPAEFAATLQATHAINPILPTILDNLDQPVDMESVFPDQAFFKSELYRSSFAPYGISRILSTAHEDKRSGLYSLLTLYRKARTSHFDADHRAAQKSASYHLFHAASHAFFLHLLRTHTARPPGSAAAVTDATGQYYEAQPRFLDLIEARFSERSQQRLPFAPPVIGKTEFIGDLCIRTEPLGDLVCVYLWTSGPLDRLTLREREIVYAITQGLSFKQAARKIGVAPSTVSNHLYRIYRKLGVNSRTELATLVFPSGQEHRDESGPE